MNTLVNLFDGYDSSVFEDSDIVNTLNVDTDTLNEVKELLEFQLSDMERGLNYHMKYNQPWNPLGESFTEILHAAMYTTRCTGSAGSGWDQIDMGESKFTNRSQSRKCKSCGAKVMFFLERCPE